MPDTVILKICSNKHNLNDRYLFYISIALADNEERHNMKIS